ncbi:MAG: hypothetical protein AB2A00_23655 [Myxococcota bacterium]
MRMTLAALLLLSACTASNATPDAGAPSPDAATSHRDDVDAGPPPEFPDAGFLESSFCFGPPAAWGHFYVWTVDFATQERVLDSVASVEEGGIYLPDHNAYAYGAHGNAEGRLDLRFPTSTNKGFHTFADGYFYGALVCNPAENNAAVILMRPLGPGRDKPLLANARATPSTVQPGGSFTLQVDLSKNTDTAEHSDETLWVEPITGTSGRLLPPSPPVNENFPDGTYAATLTAPSEPGTYRYYLSATFHNCVTSDRAVVDVMVTP